MSCPPLPASGPPPPSTANNRSRRVTPAQLTQPDVPPPGSVRRGLYHPSPPHPFVPPDRFPHLIPEEASAAHCLYTTTPDTHFVVDRTRAVPSKPLCRLRPTVADYSGSGNHMLPTISDHALGGIVEKTELISTRFYFLFCGIFEMCFFCNP